MKSEIPVQDLPHKGVELLRDVMREIKIDSKERPQEYIFVLHANHIVQLADEIVFLESHNYRAASSVIARAIYESLFKLALGLEKPELAAEKALREVEWSFVQEQFKGANPKELKQIRKRPEYAPIGNSILSIGQRWKLSIEKINSAETYSTSWCARTAGMTQVYQRQYAELSAYAHASADTFIERSLNITTGQVLVYVSFALLLAATKIVEKYFRELPRELIIEVKEFDQLFRFYDKAGHIKNFLLGELTKTHPTKPNSPEKKFEKN
jgi:hypothetical protein